MRFIKQFGIQRIRAKDLPAEISFPYEHAETLSRRPRMDDWNSCAVANIRGNIALTNGVWFTREELVGKSKLKRGMGPERVAKILYERVSGIKVAQTSNLSVEDVRRLTSQGIPVMICRKWWEHEESKETHYDTLLGVDDGRLFWHNPSKPNGAATDGFCCMPIESFNEYLTLPTTRQEREAGLQGERYGLIYVPLDLELLKDFRIIG